MGQTGGLEVDFARKVKQHGSSSLTNETSNRLLLFNNICTWLSTLTKLAILRHAFFSKFIHTVCGEVPKVVNGTFFGKNRPTPFSITYYACNEGYFAFGPNADNTQTQCLSNRSYTLDSEQLLQCVSIGQLLIFSNCNFVKEKTVFEY